jgi:ribonuclease HIII
MSQIGLFPPAAGHIGTDESGKGDYFGPLVIAGVYVPDDQTAVLRELGVRDSKTLSDNRVRDIAAALMEGYIHSIVAIGPDKYNELYEKFRNLNKLLAWGHARVIENILGRIDCLQAVTDQFGDERFVLNALMQRGRKIELIQRPRAEEDPAVAAASILARADFVRRIGDLSREWGVDLHKGAGPPVEASAAAFLRRHGAAALPKVAKMHFKITERVLRSI